MHILLIVLSIALGMAFERLKAKWNEFLSVREKEALVSQDDPEELKLLDTLNTPGF